MKPTAIFVQLAMGMLLAEAAHAQVSLATAVEMSLSSSPRVKMAESDAARARAAWQEAKDIYVPSASASSSAPGYSYGFPLGTPTVFSLQAQSLVFNFSQKDYVRAAHLGMDASELSVQEIREQVAEDTVLTYLALDREQRQHEALIEESGYATRLEAIVKDRLDVGQDSAMEYTKARRTNVQLHLQLLQLDDQIATDSDHLARLMGVAGTRIATIDGSIPAVASAAQAPVDQAAGAGESPGILASEANAKAKREQAFGESRYLYRPQLTFGASYSRFSTYNNAYATYYPGIEKQPNAFGFAVSVTIPFVDKTKQAHAREALEDAVHAEQQVAIDRQNFLEGRLKLRHNVEELQDKAELASLDRDMAKEQLDAVLVQLQATANGAPPMTPKDEQNARIAERQRYIEMLDAEFQLRQAEVSLLRQTGGLEDWLKQAGGLRGDSLPVTPVVVPR